MNQFIADTAAMGTWQEAVHGVGQDVSSFKNAFSGPSDLASSHGAIGFPMQNAFGGAHSAREGALGATGAAASRMAELLGQASQAYQRGDMDAASRLKAQADQIEGASSAASSGGGANPASAAGGGAGQMLGQFGQMAGQMAQSITQPLQGLSQAMSQLPQQAMQGVQGIVEAATSAAGGGAETASMAADVGGAGAEEAVKAGATDHQGPGDENGAGDPHDGKPDEDDKKRDAEHRGPDEDRDRPAETGNAADRHFDQLGNRATSGVAQEDGFGVGTVPTQFRNVTRPQ